MSFFAQLKGFFSDDLYVQVWENRIKVTASRDVIAYDQEPLLAVETKKDGARVVTEVGNACRLLDANRYEIINPFKHPRVLLGDFLAAEKLVQYAFQQVHKGKFFAPAPRVIFQPMEKTEGGLSPVEVKAFEELCLGAGARDVAIYVGHELVMQDLNFDSIKKSRQKH